MMTGLMDSGIVEGMTANAVIALFWFWANL